MNDIKKDIERVITCLMPSEERDENEFVYLRNCFRAIIHDNALVRDMYFSAQETIFYASREKMEGNKSAILH